MNNILHPVKAKMEMVLSKWNISQDPKVRIIGNGNTDQSWKPDCIVLYAASCNIDCEWRVFQMREP